MQVNKNQLALDIRKDIEDFAKEEIFHLINLDEIDVKHDKIFNKIKDFEERRLAIANHNAYNIAFKIFRLHDTRLEDSFSSVEIAIILNITVARVDQIEKKAMNRLKHPKYSRAFKNYVKLSVSTHSMEF